MRDNEKFDIAVIGGGPGGYASAVMASRLNLKVVLIEKDKIGGTCLNRGCIPTKALKHCADVFNTTQKAGVYGVQSKEVELKFSSVMGFKNRVVNRLVQGLSYLIKSNKIKYIYGEGKIINPTEVHVTTSEGTQKICAQNIIVATGAEEAKLPGLEPDGNDVLNSTQALNMNELPKNMVIIGGGVVGVEFASIFNNMGTNVTIIELAPRLLPFEDHEVSQVLERQLSKKGIKVYTRSRVEQVQKGSSNQITVKIQDISSEASIKCDKVLVCTGRRPSIRNTGIENIGIKINGEGIVTDRNMRTNIPNIYAVGDVTGKEQLAHVAFSEAKTAISDITGKTRAMDYRAVPHCIWSDPEIASVGLREQEAKEKYKKIRVSRFPFQANGRALIEGKIEGFVKLVIDDIEGRVLGSCIIGPYATEMIQEIALAVNKNMSIEDIADTIHPHPTFTEALGEAALAAVGYKLHF